MNLFKSFIKLISVAIFCFNQSCIQDKEPQGVTLEVGDSLPTFSVMLSNGQKVSNSTLEGKTGVIVFFNTLCTDCQQELPVIQKIWEEYKDDDMVIIAPIARKESEESIMDYWGKNNLTMPYSPQETTDIYNLFAPNVIPRIYISNPKGIITFTSGDTDMPSVETLRKEINSALK